MVQQSSDGGVSQRSIWYVKQIVWDMQQPFALVYGLLYDGPSALWHSRAECDNITILSFALHWPHLAAAASSSPKQEPCRECLA